MRKIVHGDKRCFEFTGCWASTCKASPVHFKITQRYCFEAQSYLMLLIQNIHTPSNYDALHCSLAGELIISHTQLSIALQKSHMALNKTTKSIQFSVCSVLWVSARITTCHLFGSILGHYQNHSYQRLICTGCIHIQKGSSSPQISGFDRLCLCVFMCRAEGSAIVQRHKGISQQRVGQLLMPILQISTSIPIW